MRYQNPDNDNGMKITNRTSIVLGVIVCGSMLGHSVVAAEQARPNIIVIMADDLGYNDVGCYGCKDIPTPHIDSLAKEGVRFTSGYVTWPMCGPSRAGFLTGRHQASFGYYKNASLPFDPKQGLPKMETIASLLQKQGYVTGGVGKWHMGTTNDQHPNSMGFDDWFGFLSGGLMYYPLDHPSYKGRFTPLKRPAHWRDIHHTLPLIHNMEPVQWDQYLTRELTDAGGAFLKKNQTEPFFLFMSYNAPHLDLEAPEETIAKFPEEKMSKVPGVTPKARSIYGAMVYELDQGVGQLLTELDQLELTDNTVVWFLSDHGGMKRTSDNRPLKGAKGNSYEGGLRVPMIVKWPGRIPEGVVLEEAVTSLDIGATAIAMAGGDPENAGLHGKDIRPYMTQQSKDAPHDVLYWHTARGPGLGGVIREGNYKLLVKGKMELYHLADDLGETNNLAASQPERVQNMLARWKEWNKGNAPDLWGKPEKPYQYADYEWLKGSQHYKATPKKKRKKATEKSAKEELVDVSEGRPAVRLWPLDQVGGAANRLKHDVTRRGKVRYENVKDPHLVLFSAQRAEPNPAVIYCPGGSYVYQSPKPEIIEWLNECGITVFMLKYRASGDREAAFEDMQRAMCLVRQNATQWNIDPNQLGVMGSSAGGHLVLRLSQHYKQRAYPKIDEADQQSCEPNFVITGSAAYLCEKGTQEIVEEFPMSGKIAPTFMVYALNDKRHGHNSVVYEKALRAVGGTTEIMASETGGHPLKGVNWFTPCEEWLKAQGIKISPVK